MRKSIAGILVSLFLFSCVFAGITYDPKDKTAAVALANKAVAFARQIGVDQALVEWKKNKPGEWMIGDIYVFCGDINGMMPINLGAPKISGTNQIGLKDTNGKPIMPEFIKIATSKKGEGFTEYFWRNPKTKLVNPKTTFIKAINSQYFVGVGYFGTED